MINVIVPPPATDPGHLPGMSALQTMSHVVDALPAAQDDVTGTLVLDVRRAGTYAQAGDILPGARWRDPECVDDWAHELPPDQTVIVYCVAGHEVSQGVALRLRAAGHNARFLVGGIEAWKANGRATSAKST